MTTNHPDPTPPTSPAAVSAPLRPVEEIRADMAGLSGAFDDLAGMCSPRGWTDAQAEVRTRRARLAADVPALLARLRAAEETLAAVEAIADEADALPDLRRNFDGSISPGIVTTDKIRAALAEGASR